MISTLLLSVAVLADPLAPARQGQVQCYEPVQAQKLCRAIGSYVFARDGSISNLATTRIQDSPPIVMFARSPVVISEGRECSARAPKDTDIERIEVAGQPLDGATLAIARSQIAGSAPDFIRNGQSLCSNYAPNVDGTLTATVDIDGVPHPELTATVLWVNPADGWKVTP